MNNIIRFENTTAQSLFVEFTNKVFNDVKKELDNTGKKMFTSTSGHSKILFNYEKYNYTIKLDNLTMLEYETLKTFLSTNGSVVKVFYNKPVLGLELGVVCSVSLGFSYLNYSHQKFDVSNLVSLEIHLKTLQP